MPWFGPFGCWLLKSCQQCAFVEHPRERVDGSEDDTRAPSYRGARQSSCRRLSRVSSGEDRLPGELSTRFLSNSMPYLLTSSSVHAFPPPDAPPLRPLDDVVVGVGGAEVEGGGVLVGAGVGVVADTVAMVDCMMLKVSEMVGWITGEVGSEGLVIRRPGRGAIHLEVEGAVTCELCSMGAETKRRDLGHDY